MNEVLDAKIKVNGTEYSFDPETMRNVPDFRGFNCIKWTNRNKAEDIYRTLIEMGMTHTNALRITECEVSQVMNYD